MDIKNGIHLVILLTEMDLSYLFHCKYLITLCLWCASQYIVEMIFLFLVILGVGGERVSEYSVFPSLCIKSACLVILWWWRSVTVFSNGYIPTWLAIFVSRFIFLFCRFCIVRFNDWVLFYSNIPLLTTMWTGVFSFIIHLSEKNRDLFINSGQCRGKCGFILDLSGYGFSSTCWWNRDWIGLINDF